MHICLFETCNSSRLTGCLWVVRVIYLKRFSLYIHFFPHFHKQQNWHICRAHRLRYCLVSMTFGEFHPLFFPIYCFLWFCMLLFFFCHSLFYRSLRYVCHTSMAIDVKVITAIFYRQFCFKI